MAMTSPSDPPLSLFLKQHTQVLHRTAEQSWFVHQCLGGRLGIEAWRTYLVGLYELYRPLELALGALRSDHASVSPFADPMLARSEAIRTELRSLGAALPASARPSAPKPLAYTIGQAYARYFGDLMGGAILRRAAQQIAPGAGDHLNFPFERKAKLRELRAALDEAPFGPSDRDTALVGARDTFTATIRLFDRASPAPLEVQVPEIHSGS